LDKPHKLPVAAGRLHPIALRSFLRFAARERWLSGEGATIEVPTLPEGLPKPLKAGDRDQILEALTDDTLT